MDRLLVNDEAIVVATGRLGLVVAVGDAAADPQWTTVLDYGTGGIHTYDTAALMRRPHQPGDTVRLQNPATGKVDVKATVIDITPGIPGIMFIAECNDRIRPVYGNEPTAYDRQPAWRERQLNVERSRVMLRPAAEWSALYQRAANR